MLKAADLLRPVDMPQGDIGRRRKGAGGKGLQAADINLAHRIAGTRPDRGQMARGNNRQVAAQLGTFGLGQGIEGLVMLLNRLLQRLLLVLRALPGLAFQHIARADKGDGAENRPRRAIAPMQHQQLFSQIITDTRNHPRAELGQQRLALTEHGHRIMVATEHHQLAASGAQLDDKAVVVLTGVAGRRAGVEDIAGNQHGIHLMRAHLLDQPGAEGLMLGLAGLTHKVLAQVPVGCMQNAHA